MSVRVIGIDCATDPRKVGVAFGNFANGAVAIESVRVGSREWKWPDIVASVAREIRAAPQAILALDAPLGWPASMGVTLAEHTAGSTLNQTADRMFLRKTDHIITAVAKKPLEVGANLIARTAHSALRRLNEIRKESGNALSLAWDPTLTVGAQAIEVYPAATLLAHGLSDTGYKGSEPKHRRRREQLTAQMAKNDHLSGVAGVSTEMQETDHALDAIVCCLATADFLRGDAIPPDPDQVALAKKEGWIWAKQNPHARTSVRRA